MEDTAEAVKPRRWCSVPRFRLRGMGEGRVHA
jgi:hypothetical protein